MIQERIEPIIDLVGERCPFTLEEYNKIEKIIVFPTSLGNTQHKLCCLRSMAEWLCTMALYRPIIGTY